MACPRIPLFFLACMIYLSFLDGHPQPPIQRDLPALKWKKVNPEIERTYHQLIKNSKDTRTPPDIPLSVIILANFSNVTDSLLSHLNSTGDLNKTLRLGPGLETAFDSVTNPRLLVDKVTGYHFTILPPLMAERNLRQDITASYLSQKVADSILGVKVVLAIEYQENNSHWENDFGKFLSRASKFVHHSQIQNSTILAISYEGQLGNEIIIAGVQAGLENHKKEIRLANRSDSGHEEKVVDGLQVAQNIYIVTPNVSNLVTGLARINYSHASFEDGLPFGHFLNEKSLSNLSNYLDVFQTKIEFTLNTSFTEWKRQLRDKINKGVVEDDTDFEMGSNPTQANLSLALLSKHEHVLLGINSSSSYETPEKMVKLLTQSKVQELVKLPNSLLLDLFKSSGPAKFISSLIGEQETGESSSDAWKLKLAQLTDFIASKKLWYSFLGEMGKTLAETEKKPGMVEKVVLENYRKWVENQTKTSKGRTLVKGGTVRKVPTAQELVEIDEVMEDVSDAVSHDCEEKGVLTLKGSVITLDVTTAEMFKSCDGTLRPQYVILASEKVIIKNFSFVGNLGSKSFLVMTPLVEAIGDGLVYLEGEEGEDGSIKAQKKDNYSCDENFSGRGGIGGSFSVITKTVTGNLTVTSQGGLGGATWDRHTAIWWGAYNEEWGGGGGVPMMGIMGYGGFPGEINIIQLSGKRGVDILQKTGSVGHLQNHPFFTHAYDSFNPFFLLPSMALCGTSIPRVNALNFNSTEFYGEKNGDEKDRAFNLNDTGVISVQRFAVLFKDIAVANKLKILKSFYVDMMQNKEVDEIQTNSALSLLEDVTQVMQLNTLSTQIELISSSNKTDFLEELISNTLTRILNFTKTPMGLNSSLECETVRRCEAPTETEGYNREQCLLNGYMYHNGTCYLWYIRDNDEYQLEKRQSFDFNRGFVFNGKWLNSTVLRLDPYHYHIGKISDVYKCLVAGKTWILNADLTVIINKVNNRWYNTDQLIEFRSGACSNSSQYDGPCDEIGYEPDKKEGICTTRRFLWDYSLHYPYACSYLGLGVLPQKDINGSRYGYPNMTLRDRNHLGYDGNKCKHDDSVRECIHSGRALSLNSYCKTVRTKRLLNATGLAEKKALALAYTALLSKLNSLRYHSSDFIINIEGYLTTSHALIVEFKKLEDIKKTEEKGADKNQRALEQNQQMQARVEKALTEYDNDIQNKTMEATTLIKLKIQPDVDRVNVKLSKKIEEILAHLHQLIEQAEQDKEAAEQAKKDMEDAMIAKGVFGGLGIVTGVLGMMGPVGQAIGAGVGAASSIAQTAFDATAGPDPTTTLNGIGSRLGTFSSDIENFLSTTYKEKHELAVEKIRELNEIYKDLPEKKFSNEIASFNAVHSKFTTGGEAPKPDYLALKGYQDDMAEGIRKISEKSEADTNSTITRAQKVLGALTMINTAAQVYQGVKNDMEQIDQATDIINALDKKISNLKKMEDTAASFIGPLVANIKDASDSWSGGNVTGKSLALLKVMKYEAQKNIRETRDDMEKFTATLGKDFGFKQLTENLDNALVVTFDLYDQIEKWNEQRKFADLMATINQKEFTLPFDAAPELEQAIVRMQHAVVSNSIIYVYNKALAAILQVAFPFAHLLLADFQLPNDFDLENTNDVVTRTAERMTALMHKVQNQKNVIDKSDKYIFNASFYESEFTSAFHVWDGETEEMQHYISELFDGHTILLHAPILESTSVYDAVKFNFIELLFEVKDDAKETEELNHQLKHYKIQLSHTGSSYYRCNDEYYMFLSPTQPIEYSFLKDNVTNEPAISNHVYGKLKKGDLVLSPYTTWSIKLKKMSKANGFDRLAPFKGKSIDLHLAGKGQYVEPNALLNVDITGYYKPVDGHAKIEKMRIDRTLPDDEDLGRSFRRGKRASRK